MKIKHSLEMKKLISNLLFTVEANENNAERLNEYIASTSLKDNIVIKDEMSIDEKMKYFLKTILPYFDNDKKLVKNALVVNELDKKIFENNPYLKTINFKNIEKNKWELRRSSLFPYNGFVYDEIIVKKDLFFKEITPFGFFSEPYSYLEVIQNDTNWMSITPHEILTMEGAIEQAKKSVLTFGLGMGYFPFMVSIKNDVDKIVVVEKDKNAIDLFTKYILPQFPYKHKIKIIQADAFNFANKIHDGEYDNIFVDIWRQPLDGLPLYLRFKKIFKNYKTTSISYWVERSMLALLRRCVIVLLDEEYNLNLSDNDYLKSNNEIDKIINSLHFNLKNIEILNPNSLIDFLDDKNLMRIATS